MIDDQNTSYTPAANIIQLIIKYSWKPWDDLANYQNDVLPIEHPPCAKCRWWQPVKVYQRGRYEGVRLCHSDDMHHDFSCFQTIKELHDNV